ncbi:glycosyltransferase family protein [Methylomonas sp. BW4-1]|uniref:glycosyltransferase family protein n=1 Tax=Methylomonas sp. BW4-1 TaxID=3376685 RepID=UPI0040426F71
MNSAVKDIFFLNIEDAYAEASKQQSIVDESGCVRRQYCYYDGLLTDIVLPNFIQVPADKFVEFFSHNQLPIPQLIAISQDGAVHFNDMPRDVIDEVMQYRSQYRVPDYVHFDTYFIDPLQALNVAKQANRVSCGHPTIDGLQICYYRGELPESDLPNLIHLELPDYEEFFIRSRLRIPENIDIPDGLEEEVKAAIRQDIVTAGESIKRRRLWLIQQLLNKAKALPPRWVGNRPPRIFIPTSRLTTVMQYSSQGLAKAFAALGWEVLFYIQDNDMEGSNMVDMLEKYIDFDPHACLYVNSLNNSFMHDDIVNIVWWQDLMPQLKDSQPLKWRARDFNFSISPLFDRYLEQRQAALVQRLHFVIDDVVFHAGNNQARADKIVFVGSSYLPVINIDNSQHRQALDSLIAAMESGACFDEASVRQIAETSGLSYEFVFWKLLHYVIRDYSVKWLCADTGLPVDVYGRYWDQDAEVAPFYRGELPHGEAVAEVYRSTRYALVCHPFEINSQRLAEAAACGCVPVVYDCRDVAEPPYWEDYCLFFKTADQLRNILHKRLQPAKAPEGLAAQFTYRAAADRLIELSDLRLLVKVAAPPAPESVALLPELFGDKLHLLAGAELGSQTFLAQLQTNLACLAQHRPALHEALLAAWSQQPITIFVDQAIRGEYWRVSVAQAGEQVYRLDNIALLEHRRLIAENAQTMARENTCCYALVGWGAGYELLAAFRATESPIPEMAEFEVPVYLIETKPAVWLLNLLLHDLQPLLAAGRLRIFSDLAAEADLTAEFSKFEAALPDMLFNSDPNGAISSERVYQLSVDAKQARAERHAANLRQVADYYQSISSEQWRKKFSAEKVGELRVMGFISRFSSFLKYCMRDWLDGFQRLGATVLLCSETENYYLTNIEHLIDEINRFKPDLILTIDHFRHEFEGIPATVPFVNWIQDMLPNIRFNEMAPGPFDLNFVFARRWLSFNTLPLYGDYPLQFLPLGFNDSQYYPLQEETIDCDVLLVSHLEAPGKTLQPLRDPTLDMSLLEQEDAMLRSGALNLAQLRELYAVLEHHCALMTMTEFEEFCTVHPGKTAADFRDLFARHGYALSDELLDLLLCVKGNRLHCEYLNRMKYWPIQLLMDAFPNLKIQLYGKHWEAYPAFADLARGIAENGTALNRIMQRAKICLNANPGVTLHMRALEIIAAGRFMLSRQMLYDGSPLREFFDADAVVLYDDEADLLAKAAYYLNNSEARKQVAANALRGLDAKLSYRAVAKRVLTAACQRFSKLAVA